MELFNGDTIVFLNELGSKKTTNGGCVDLLNQLAKTDVTLNKVYNKMVYEINQDEDNLINIVYFGKDTFVY